MSPTRCLVVQHIEAEGPGAIADALSAEGVAVETCRVFAGEQVPSNTGGLDGLVLMGGPMSAVADDGFPTRRRELALAAAGLADGVPTLGICLGAQLLALATGGHVFPGENGLEIGWGPVSLTDAADDDTLFSGCPDELQVLHWHGDTFELGPGSVLLASNATYRSQAFRTGRRAWGLQFHIEVDAGAVARMAAAFPEDAAKAGGERALQVEGARWFPTLGPVADRVLSRFAAQVAAGRSRRPAQDVL